jgi:DNA-binding NtrC family response regulator
MRPVLLLAGLDPSSRDVLRETLEKDHEIHAVEGASAALAFLRRHPVAHAVIGIRLPDGAGLDLLRQVRRFDDGIDVVMLADERDVETALSAMKSGACDYLSKPVHPEAVQAAFARLREHREVLIENRMLREQVHGCRRSDILLGPSPSSQQLERRIAEAAAEDGPVLVRGEVGTEREAVAREIHRRMPGGHRPFVTASAQGLGREALEADLFGRREAARGRGVPHPGKLEFAEGGTLFLDHADRMPPEIQARLLQAFRPLPAGRAPAVRVLASCTVDPAQPAPWNEGWRAWLSTRVIEVPPLRERRKDIPGLIARHLDRVGALSRAPLKGLTREAEQFLTRYAWPGNVVELENTIEIMSLTADHGTLGMEDLPLDILIKQIDEARGREEARLSLKKARRRFERQYIRKVLEGTRGNQTRAAETLGLHRNTLLWKLRDLEMRDEYEVILEKRRGRASRRVAGPRRA